MAATPNTSGIRPAVDGQVGSTSRTRIGTQRERAPQERAKNVQWKKDEPVEVIEVCCSPDSVMARGAAEPPVLRLTDALVPDGQRTGLLESTQGACAIVAGLCVGMALVLSGMVGVVTGLVILAANTRALFKAAPPSLRAKIRVNWWNRAGKP